MELLPNTGHLIVIGEYDDQEVVAVVVGTEAEAQEVADRYTLQTAKTPNGALWSARIEGTATVHTFSLAAEEDAEIIETGRDRLDEFVRSLNESVARHKAAADSTNPASATAAVARHQAARATIGWKHGGDDDPRDQAATSVLTPNGGWALGPMPSTAHDRREVWTLMYIADKYDPTTAFDVGDYDSETEAKGVALRYERSGVAPVPTVTSGTVGADAAAMLAGILMRGDPDPEHAAHVRDVAAGGE